MRLKGLHLFIKGCKLAVVISKLIFLILKGTVGGRKLPHYLIGKAFKLVMLFIELVLISIKLCFSFFYDFFLGLYIGLKVLKFSYFLTIIPDYCI